MSPCRTISVMYTFAHVVALSSAGVRASCDCGLGSAARLLYARPAGRTVGYGMLQGDDWGLHGTQFFQRLLPDVGAGATGARRESGSACESAFGPDGHADRDRVTRAVRG